MAFAPSQFTQLVFSGGGTRCFWHGGFLSKTGIVEDFAPDRVCGVSGGALSASAWISGNAQVCKQVMGEIFERNEQNIDLGKSNATPHQELYREAVSGILPHSAVNTIADGPAFQILLGCPPAYLPSRVFAAICGIGYKVEQIITGSPSLKYTQFLGLDAMLVDARQAARDGELVDLICAAATIPPVFDIPKWRGRDVIDGSMVTKAPFPEPERGKTLVLMTTSYRNIPDDDKKAFVTPSKEVEADKIDFTRREKIQETWEQGQIDAMSFMAKYE